VTDFVISEDWLQRMDNSPMLSVMQIRDLFAEARSRPLSDEKPCDHCDFNERDAQMADAIMKAKKAERERVLDEVMQKLDYRFNDTERGRRGVETCREVIESMRGEP